MLDRKKRLAELDIEQRHAAMDYLDVVKNHSHGPSYAEAEGWAWARLQSTLRTIRRERARLAA